jgi:hypothetical protein
MKRTLTAAGATLAVLTIAPLAMAQRGAFGQQGEFIISADRLMPLFSFDDVSQADLEAGAGDPAIKSVTNTSTSPSLSLLYGGTANPNEVFYTAPRVGLDYVVVPNVTIGGSIVAVFSIGGSNKTETDNTNGQSSTTSVDHDSVSGFGIAPRAGYILPLTDIFALWLRGGLSFYVASDSPPSNNNGTFSTTVNQLSLDLEPQLVFTGIPHVGFTAGLDADIPLTGGIKDSGTNNGVSTSVSGHSSIFFLGLELGMLAHF